MRFNKTGSNWDDKGHKENDKENAKSASSFIKPAISDNNRLIVVGTIKVDEHSRLTFSKRIKDVFPILPNDTIVVYKDVLNENLIFKVQRYTEVSDTWIITRERINTVLSNTQPASNNASNQINVENKKTKDKEQLLKSTFNIMIIDDEPDIVTTFKTVLQEDGKNMGINYNIETFTSSTQAIKQFIDINNNNKHSLYYDLILIDIKMPDINGVQLYQILKIINSDVKVLFISALDATGDLAGILPGIKPEDVIRKPVESGYLLAKTKEKLNL